MRIDMKRQAELSKRQGFANRTIFAVIALSIGFVLAYLLTSYLFAEEILTFNFFYNQLFIPKTVSEGVIRFGVAVLGVFFLQFLGIIAYALTSPSARVRPGTPSVLAQDPDYYESFNYAD